MIETPLRPTDAQSELRKTTLLAHEFTSTQSPQTRLTVRWSRVMCVPPSTRTPEAPSRPAWKTPGRGAVADELEVRDPDAGVVDEPEQGARLGGPAVRAEGRAVAVEGQVAPPGELEGPVHPVDAAGPEDDGRAIWHPGDEGDERRAGVRRAGRVDRRGDGDPGRCVGAGFGLGAGRGAGLGVGWRRGDGRSPRAASWRSAPAPASASSSGRATRTTPAGWGPRDLARTGRTSWILGRAGP